MPSSTTMSAGLRRGRRDELLDAVLARRLELRDDTLMHAAARRAIERRRIDALHAHAPLARQREDLFDTLVAALIHANAANATRTQGFDDRVDAEDDHGSNSQLPTSTPQTHRSHDPADRRRQTSSSTRRIRPNSVERRSLGVGIGSWRLGV
jgi:hypothetical protein